MFASVLEPQSLSQWWTPSTTASSYAPAPSDKSLLHYVSSTPTQRQKRRRMMNKWEESAIEARENEQLAAGTSAWDPAYAHFQEPMDPLIYPGLYSRTGFDILDVLFRVTARPNPQVDLGAIDASCALILCDLFVPDTPIVYASEPFLALTGYTESEVMGRNCRFLQAPPPRCRSGSSSSSSAAVVEHVTKGSRRKYISSDIIRRMRKAVENNTELQIEVPNFRKDGTRFVNILTMIPIRWEAESDTFRYSVGFQCAKD